MPKILLSFLFFMQCSMLFAKQGDSLFVVSKHDRWVLEYYVKKQETILAIANKYHLPPAVLSDFNKADFNLSLNKGQFIYIPLGAYNHLKSKPVNPSSARPFYYRVTEEDNLGAISMSMGVMQKTIQEWNGLPDNNIRDKTVLIAGWVLWTDSTIAKKETVNKKPLPSKKNNDGIPEGIRSMLSDEELTKIKRQDPDSTLSEEERLYLSQTNHGMFTANDKGSAVFFDMPGKASGNKYYAFHNLARRGTIIKIYNPGNTKIIFAKVLGPIPTTKQYFNSIIGISAGAKAALGTNQTKLWCELSYAP